MKALQFITALLIGLWAQGSLAQTTTVLNFDNIGSGVGITDQYQAQGVMVTGATAIDATMLGFSARSGTQVAYAQLGLMTFNLSIANVKTVSAYVSGVVIVGLYAYDANSNLLGQALLPANAPANTLLSVTSANSSIARVEIHNGGENFAVDDFSFTTAASTPQEPVCRTYGKNLYNAIAALPASAFVCPATVTRDRNRLLSEVATFENLRASGAGQKKLLAAMQLIQKDVKNITKSKSNKSILQQIDQLLSLIKANGC